MPSNVPLFPGERLPSQPRSTGPSFQDSVRNFSLRGILDDRFSGELDRLTESQPDLETRFLEALRSPVNFEDFRGELTDFAQSVTSDVFGPGGAVQGALNQTSETLVGRGLDPFGGTATRSRNDILRGATQNVSNAIGQQAGQLAGLATQQRAGDIASLLGFTEFQGQRGDALRESLFGGQATIENLGLARGQFDLNRQLVEESLRRARDQGGFWDSLGGLAGGLLGTVAAPIGTAVGTRLGDDLVGSLFGPE